MSRSSFEECWPKRALFEVSELQRRGLDEDSCRVLSEVGLPFEAGPVLRFGDRRKERASIESVIERFGLTTQDLAELETDLPAHWVIGVAEAGDPVTVTDDGRIWTLNHEDGFQGHLLAPSLAVLIEALIAWRDYEQSMTMLDASEPMPEPHPNKIVLDRLAALSDEYDRDSWWSSYLEWGPEEQSAEDDLKSAAGEGELDDWIDKIDDLPTDEF